MSLFVPLDKINVIQHELKIKFVNHDHTTALTVYDENYNEIDFQEIVNPRKGADYEHKVTNDKGELLYTTHYKYQNINAWNSNGTCDNIEGIAITLHSKQLHSNYLMGITELNIDDIYDNIISQGVINTTREDFMASNVSDIDIKTDYAVDNFTAYTNLVYANIIEHWKGSARKMKIKGRISGLQIFKREHKANPYFKLYDKQLELKTKSKAFHDQYLTGQQIPQARVEITLCNSKALKKYGLLPIGQTRTLESILQQTSKMGETTMCKIQREYIHMVMFGSSESLNPEQIQGKQPPASVLNKIDKLLAELYLHSKGAPMNSALTTAKIFTQKDHHRYVRNYIITKFSHFKMDAALLELRK